MKCWYLIDTICDRPPGVCEGCERYEDWRKKSERMIVEKDTPWVIITGLDMTSDKMMFGEHEPHWEFNIKMRASKNVPMTDLVKLLMDGKDRTFIEELMKYLLYVEVKE